jgi:NAD(P)-dependent dehydrogenase (short-subunit alcohol dehydrogenase family)
MSSGVRSVVITGASTGIGAACAVRLDALGFRVFAGVRRAEDGEALQKECSSRLMPISLDVTDPASIAAAAERVSAIVGDQGLAGLVNNAGIAVGGPIELVPMSAVRSQFEVNVFGQIAVTQAFLPLLRRGRGRVVNMGSIAGRAATPYIGLYSASKFAMEALTDALRSELQPWGIEVSIVEPGAIATQIWKKSARIADDMKAGLSDGARRLYGEQITSVRSSIQEVEKRAIPATAVAEAVVHALSAKRPKARYLVGIDARIRAAMAAWLPDRVQDRVLRWFLKLPSKGSRSGNA